MIRDIRTAGTGEGRALVFRLRAGSVILMALVCGGCAMGPENRLLAVGGTYAFEGRAGCHLVRAEPPTAVRDLHWKDALVLQAEGEGTAEVTCGQQKLHLQIVAPARLALERVEGKLAEATINQRFMVRARLFDHSGRELEVGKYTQIEWSSSGALVRAEDRSAGEFGFCDACFGMQGFRALQPGAGTIEARLGKLRGTLNLKAVTEGSTGKPEHP